MCRTLLTHTHTHTHRTVSTALVNSSPLKLCGLWWRTQLKTAFYASKRKNASSLRGAFAHTHVYVYMGYVLCSCVYGGMRMYVCILGTYAVHVYMGACACIVFIGYLLCICTHLHNKHIYPINTVYWVPIMYMYTWGTYWCGHAFCKVYVDASYICVCIYNALCKVCVDACYIYIYVYIYIYNMHPHTLYAKCVCGCTHVHAWMHTRTRVGHFWHMCRSLLTHTRGCTHAHASVRGKRLL